MELCAEFGTLPNDTMAEGPESKQKPLLPGDPHQAKSEGSILLQLLEFKTHLLEAVEELHIRRALQLSKCCSLGGEVKKQKDVMMAPDIPEQDAEAHFEAQISKLVLEKQGLEWEKDSQRHQIETAAIQHSESLINVKKQFQAKIRNIEEEKGKYQVSVELKDKEINNLKEELKSLQLLKYNLEKKSSELEQKLALQSRLKDTHLNQLGEVEKRFRALSWQCAMVKQAHEKLEQNVDEAMKINKKFTSANEKQEETITSLNKEVEELSNKLIKIKMSSVIHEKPSSPTALQQIQQLHHKLHMETEMNRKVKAENVALRSEKQEVMRSLLLAQQLLLSQTQTVNGVELELQTQIEKYQALKQEHEVMREKSKAVEEEMVQLKESYTASTVALKETTALVDQMKSDRQDFLLVKEAYEELQKKHMEPSTQAKVNVSEQEMPESSENLSVSTSSGERPPDEPKSDSTLPSFNRLRRSQTKNSDYMKDTDAVTKRVATGSLGEQGASALTPQSPSTDTPDSNPFTCLHSVSGKTYVEKCQSSHNMSVDAADVRSDLISANSTTSDGHLSFTCKYSCTSNVTNPKDEEKKKEVNREVAKAEHGGSYDEEEGKNMSKEEKRVEDNGELLQRKDAEQKEWSEKRGAFMVQTADRKDGQETEEDSADNRKPETEKTERRDEEEEGGKAPETEIQAQTTGDKNHRDGKRSDTPRVSDFTSNTQPQVTAFKPPDCSQSLSQKVTEEKSNHGQLLHSFNSDMSQVFTCGSDDIIYEGRSHDGEPHDHPASFQERGKNSAETRKSTTDFVVEVCEPLNQSSMCRSQSDQLDGVSVQETITAQTQQVCSSDVTGDMKLTDKTCDADVAEGGASVQNMSEPLRSPPNEEKPEQENGDLGPVATQTTDGLSWINVCEMDASVSEPIEKPNITDKQLDCVDVKVNIEDAETGNCQKHLKNVTEDTKSAQSESESKLKSAEVVGSCLQERPPPKDMCVNDFVGLTLPSSKTYRLEFESGSAQRRTVNSNAPPQDGLFQVPGQETSMSLQNVSRPGGVFGHHLSTLPKFLKGKHHKVPLVITTATDLLNASSVCGTAASSRRHQQGEWKAIGEACRETAAADTENTVSGCVSNSSISSRLSTQTSPGFSRTVTPSVGPNPESEQGPSCSQDTEEQQSSFRAQISKIEQFLNTERLCLPKKTKN